jgi:hypothetical protein
MSSEMRKDDQLIFCMLRKGELCCYAEPTRADAGQAGSLRGHSTQLGTEGYINDVYKTSEPLQEAEALDRPCTRNGEMRRRLAEGISQHQAFALQCRTRIRTILGGPRMLLLSFKRNRKG